MVRPLVAQHLLRGIEWFSLRAPTLPPFAHINTWLLGTDERILVDPGCTDPQEKSRLIAWLRSRIDAGEFRLRGALLTHHHPDHVGAAAQLAEQLHVPLWAHQLTASLLPYLSVSRYLVDGDIISLAGSPPHAWRVLHTPGHAPGHLCLLEPSVQALVLGDMAAGQGTILIANKDGGDMAAYLAQLDRLSRIDALVGLPGHGDPFRRPSEKLEALRTHRLQREARVVEVLGAWPDGIGRNDLLAAVYQDTPVRLWPMAVLSLEAHLEKLIDEGRVRERRAQVFCLL